MLGGGRALLALAALAALGTVLAVFSPGCGSKGDPVTPVRGTVAYRGSPLRGGTIVFTPDASKGTRGPLALGEIQPDGTYVLKTGESPGAVAGWHRITVVAVQAASAPQPGQRFAIPQSLVPERYRDPELCGLSREVKAGEGNVLDFDLD
jgi:hypothetical protein